VVGLGRVAVRGRGVRRQRRVGLRVWRCLLRRPARGGRDDGAAASTLASARNNAQTLANSLEILGDAQPTQANYDQVLNTFDVNGALSQLRSAVTTLNATLAG